MSGPIGSITDVIKSTLEITPPELCADIYENGIMLAGGGSLLPGMAMMLQSKTGLTVNIAKHPLDCVADGIMKIMSSNAYKSVLTEVKK